MGRDCRWGVEGWKEGYIWMVVGAGKGVDDFMTDEYHGIWLT